MKSGCFSKGSPGTGPWVGEAACECSKSHLSVHRSALGLVGEGPHSLQSQMFQVPVLQVRAYSLGNGPFIPGERLQVLSSHAMVGSTPGADMWWQCARLPFCDHVFFVFISLMWRGLLCQFSGFVQRKFLRMLYMYIGASTGGREFRTFLREHLELEIQKSLKNLCSQLWHFNPPPLPGETSWRWRVQKKPARDVFPVQDPAHQVSELSYVYWRGLGCLSVLMSWFYIIRWKEVSVHCFVFKRKIILFESYLWK